MKKKKGFARKMASTIMACRKVPGGIMLYKKLNFADDPDQVPFTHLRRSAKTISKETSSLHMVKSRFLPKFELL